MILIPPKAKKSILFVLPAGDVQTGPTHASRYVPSLNELVDSCHVQMAAAADGDITVELDILDPESFAGILGIGVGTIPAGQCHHIFTFAPVILTAGNALQFQCTANASVTDKGKDMTARVYKS